ncbi:hypothetical protein Psch_02318 [Pelotomaculum schinkii]|uniref:Uncharacterized protein n=1 Tax=Pelotomaculum schinkii TaxID=78350 RepID=A0A4Y7R8Z8_9FIRM|nr:hypothetical protein Psch_02318 [Pelotomaculum schinkii]
MKPEAKQMELTVSLNKYQKEIFYRIKNTANILPQVPVHLYNLPSFFIFSKALEINVSTPA